MSGKYDTVNLLARLTKPFDMQAFLENEGLEERLPVDKPVLAGKSSLIKGSGKILLLDDELVVGAVAKEQLEALGYKVIIGLNGNEGYNKLKTVNGIALVITDLIMPECSGSEFIKRVRNDKNPIPIMVMTAFSGNNDLTGLNYDSPILQKPVPLLEDRNLQQRIRDNVEIGKRLHSSVKVNESYQTANLGLSYQT